MFPEATVEGLGATPAKEPFSILLSEASRMRGELLAQGLTAVQPRFQIAGCAITVAEVLQLAAELHPEIVIISGNLKEGPLSGFSALRQLHSRAPGLRKLMLLDQCERDGIIAAFRGGARGVFFRAGSIEQLSICIERVHQGQIWAGNRELLYVIEALSTMMPLRSVEASASGMLTRREREIVKLVGRDVSNLDISRKLNLAENAVEVCLLRIFEKLGVHSRVELAMLAAHPYGEIAGDDRQSESPAAA